MFLADNHAIIITSSFWRFMMMKGKRAHFFRYLFTVLIVIMVYWLTKLIGCLPAR